MTRKPMDVVLFIDGIKFTKCAYRGPKKGQETFPIGKSKYLSLIHI